MNKRDCLLYMDIYVHTALRYFSLQKSLIDNEKGVQVQNDYLSLKKHITQLVEETIVYEDIPLKELKSLSKNMININNRFIEVCREMKIPTTQLNWIQELWRSFKATVFDWLNKEETNVYRLYQPCTNMQESFNDQEAVMKNELGVL